jgi:alcohol dehydrogenase class IV
MPPRQRATPVGAVETAMQRPPDHQRTAGDGREGDRLDAYDVVMPPVIRFGAGRVSELGEVVALYGNRAWLVGGARSLLRSPARPAIEAGLAAAGIETTLVAESAGEPTVDQVAAAVAALPRGDRDGVVMVAVGGGSTIDLAKAVAALATNLPGDEPVDFDALVVDHLEGVGRGLPIRRWPLPLVAVPTTAGTGAEATRNAVISCPRRRFKKSMRSPMMVPRAAIVDPDLTVSCDRDTRAATGLDCITQLIEAFTCRFKRPVPRALVIDALPRAVRALPLLLREPDGDAGTHAAAREAMSHAALLSGIALANSGLGMAHGVAATLGVECGTPHGVACAVMLPLTMRVNEEVARADYALLERAVDPAASGDDAAAAASFVSRVERLCRDAGVPRRLGEVGLRRDRIGWVAEHCGGASMRGNPVEIDAGRLRRLLESHY